MYALASAYMTAAPLLDPQGPPESHSGFRKRLAVKQAIDLLIFGFGGCNAKGRGHQISNGNFFGDIQFSFFGGAT
jgi:hypothetical protein